MEHYINQKHRYLIQLSIKKNRYLFNMWDYVESFATKKEALDICTNLFDNSVHKIRLVDTINNKIIQEWC